MTGCESPCVRPKRTIACSGAWTGFAECCRRHRGEGRVGRARRRLDAADFDDLLLFEGLALQQRLRQTVQRIAVISNESEAARVALLQDPLHLVVDDLGRRFAVLLKDTETT